MTGEVWPIAELAAVAHRHGARIAVDAAQLAPHEPIDITALKVDYLALSGHKLYAPFGTGVLAGRSDWFDVAEPYLRGGGASARVGAEVDDLEWVTGPARHEAGTPNLLGAVALAAVCEALSGADRTALHRREQELLARLRSGLATIPAAVELRLFGRRHPGVGIVSIALPHHDATVIADQLGREYGVGVRAGLFCAHPLTHRLVSAAVAAHRANPAHATLHAEPARPSAAAPRPGPESGCSASPTTALRASIGLGTTESDIDRFIAALDEITARPLKG